jgi:hypothetical protein
VQPLAETVDPEQADAIERGLAGLKEYVAGIYAQEQTGTRFTAEEADTLGAEAQNRATAVTGLIAQVAAQLAIPVAE